MVLQPSCNFKGSGDSEYSYRAGQIACQLIDDDPTRGIRVEPNRPLQMALSREATKLLRTYRADIRLM